MVDIEKYTLKSKVAALLPAIKSAEKKVFPAADVFDFDAELKKQNTTLLVAYRISTSSSSTPSHPSPKSKPSKTKSKPDPTPKSSPPDSTLQLLGYAVYIRTKSLTRLHKICVLEAFRKQGIGRALLDRFVEEVKKSGGKEMDLWVDVQREAARALYKAAGFEEKEFVKDYYAKGRDAWRMALDLGL